MRAVRFPVPRSIAALPGLRDRAELAVGRGQLALLRRGVAAAAGLRAGVATVGAHRLAYLDRGRGDPVVCVHGLGGDKETWLLMAPWLPRRLRGVLVDLPGHGRSTPVAEGEATARAQAAALRAFLDAIGIERAVLAGNSMGGGVALRFAAEYPERVRALVLVGSVAPVVLPSELTEALGRGENLLVPDSREKTDAFLKSMTARPPRVPRAVQRFVAAERVARQHQLVAIFRDWAGAPAHDHVPEALERIAAPTLVVHGARDRIIHPATADLLARRLPRARRVILDGIGHLPQLEAPALVARLIADFVARLR